MTPRTVIVLLLALVCGGSAAFGVYRFYQTTRSQRTEEVVVQEMTQIVVATVEMPIVGSILTKDTVEIRDWPKGYEPAGAVMDVEEVVGKTLHVPLRQGEPVLVGKFGEGRGMASLVEVGLRAFTIHTTSNTAGVAGFVLPGDHVDVLMTRRANEETTGGSVTTTLLQNVMVLASNQMINGPEQHTIKGLKSVTLLVSPDEGKRLTLAQSGGDLTLMLRNKTDGQMVSTEPITWRDLEFSQGYSVGQSDFYANIGGFLSDIASSGAQALVARKVTVGEDKLEEVSIPELVTPAPLQIQTMRGNSLGLVLIQRER
jgi:pilus assembly protein CpaB